MKKLLFGLSAFVLTASSAQAEEIHLMCNDGNNRLRLDIDTTRLYIKTTQKGEHGVWQNGASVATTGADGYTLTYTDFVTVQDDKISFGQMEKCGDTKSCKFFGKDSQAPYKENRLDRQTGDLTIGSLYGAILDTYQCSPIAAGHAF